MGGALRKGQAVRQAPEGCPQGRRPAGKGQPPGVVAESLGVAVELGGSQRGKRIAGGPCLLHSPAGVKAWLLEGCSRLCQAPGKGVCMESPSYIFGV